MTVRAASLIVLALGALAALTGAAPPRAEASPAPGRRPHAAPRGTRLALSTHFAAHDRWQDAMASVLRRPRVRGLDTIAVSAGRPEWTYFRWEGHPDAWSPAQRSASEDLLAAAAREFREAGYRVMAIVDLEAPRYVEAHPGAAAVGPTGERSAQRVSLAELEGGEYRRALVEMVDAVARGHAVDAVEITELGHRRTSFGPADLESFRRHSGAREWPRRASGAIDVDAPAVWAWKTDVLTGLVRDLAEAAHRHGKLLVVDVPVSWDGLDRNGRDSGLDYLRVLDAADQIVVWDYFALEGVAPDASERLARHLVRELPPGSFWVSFGLWGSRGETLAPGALAEAMSAAVRGGAAQLLVTPSQLVSDAHWRAVRDLAGVAP